MKQEQHTRLSSQTSERSSKKWYHLNLFPKFALIFFCAVALPVIIIAIHGSYQSKKTLLESAGILIEDATTSIQRITEAQQRESQSALELTNEKLTHISKQTLLQLNENLISINNTLYTESIEALTHESQKILEEEFQLLNSEVASEMATIIQNFVQNVRTTLATLVASLDIDEIRAGRADQFWEALLAHEHFIQLRFINKERQQLVHATKNLSSYAQDDIIFTEQEPYLSFALSGEDYIGGALSSKGIASIRVFTPLMHDYDALGAVSGVASCLPLWERIQARFFQHEEQIYILDAQGTVMFPENASSISAAMRAELQTIASQEKAEGAETLNELLIAYTSVPDLKWKIVVVQPFSSILKRMTPVQTIANEYIKQIEEQSHMATQREVERIAREMSKQIEEKKQVIEENMRVHHEVSMTTLVEQLHANITQVATDVYKKTLRNEIPIFTGIGFLSILIGLAVAGRIIRPIKRVTALAYDISQGNINRRRPKIHSHDEIGMLSRSFDETTQYLQNIVKGAKKISEGEFTEEVTPVSEKDTLGIAFKHMTRYLRTFATLATNIARGDLSQVVTPKSETDILGNAVYQMTRYLQQTAQIARKVAGGNLSENPRPQSEKDFLGNAFAEMIFKLRHLVAKIRSGADQLVTLSMESQSRAQQEAESVEKISLSVEETSTSMNEMAVTIGQVDERMKELSSFVGETSSSIEELNSSIRQISSHGEQLALGSEETSSSIQQISASLQQIAGTAQHSKMLSDGACQDAINGRESVEKMIQSMNEIQHMVNVTAEAIQLLKKRTESIEKILDVIKDISDQTSLLSINASIIAKKAGERGRGFNVIADKVRKLADQSTSSTKEIAKIIRDVQKDSAHAVEVVLLGNEKVQEGVELAGLAGKALDKIITGANESSSVIGKIAETTEEQTKISHHIMESMERVVEMVTQIKIATKEQEQSSDYIMKQTEQVLLLSQQVKRATFEQKEVVQHVSQAMDDIRTLIQMTSERAQDSTQSASLLSEHADALKNLVSQFTI